MTEQADKAIKAFHQYRLTGEIKFIEYLTHEELAQIMDELSRFTTDWFYPMMARRLESLKTPLDVSTVPKVKKKWLWIWLFLPVILLGRDTFAASRLYPDPTLTPGVADGRLTKDVLCAPGFSTKQYRHVTTAMKKHVFIEYGIPWEDRHGYEVDHFIPLELGGANGIENLWPEPFPEAHQKDLIENYLHAQICEDKLTLEEAQMKIKTDWYAIKK